MIVTRAAYIAHKLLAINNCRQSGNVEWLCRHSADIDAFVAEHMPSGSGLDAGTKLAETSTPERLVFTTDYHHMNEHGVYDGWTSHQVIVTASLVHGLVLRVTGRNRNDIKDYIDDRFRQVLLERCNQFTGEAPETPETSARDRRAQAAGLSES